MKMSREQALRFVAVAVGSDAKDVGKMGEYFEDVLGLGVPPSARDAFTILKFLDDANSTERTGKEGRAKAKGLRKFVALLRGLADALDPEQLRQHPAEDPVDDDENPPGVEDAD